MHCTTDDEIRRYFHGQMERKMGVLRTRIDQSMWTEHFLRANASRREMLMLARIQKVFYKVELEDFVVRERASSHKSCVVGDFLQLDGPQVFLSVLDSALEAETVFSTGRRAIVVTTENGMPAGIVTQANIRTRVICRDGNTLPANFQLGTLMDTRAVQITSSTNIRDALRIMNERKSLCIEVIDENGIIVGGIHAYSIVEAILAGEPNISGSVAASEPAPGSGANVGGGDDGSGRARRCRSRSRSWLMAGVGMAAAIGAAVCMRRR